MEVVKIKVVDTGRVDVYYRSLFLFPLPDKPIHLSRGGRQKDIMANKEEYLPVKGSGMIQECMHN